MFFYKFNHIITYRSPVIKEHHIQCRELRRDRMHPLPVGVRPEILVHEIIPYLMYLVCGNMIQSLAGLLIINTLKTNGKKLTYAVDRYPLQWE